MRLDTFYNWMSRLIKEGWEAKISRHGHIRLKQPDQVYFQHCPVSAVYYRKRGIPCDAYSDSWLGEILTQTSESLVVLASDYETSILIGLSDESLAAKRVAVRKTLKRRLGLV